MSSKSPFKVGAAKEVITPPIGTPLVGYYYPRAAEAVHDELHAHALVVSSGSDTCAIVSCDLIHVVAPVVARARALIHERTGIPEDKVLICATHAHTGPEMSGEYADGLPFRLSAAVEAATASQQPARIEFAHAEEPGLSFNRRYWMEDGSLVTNPGKRNPKVVRPAGPVDPTLYVLQMASEAGAAIGTLVNFGLHADTTGGTAISGDYPHHLREVLGESWGVVAFANRPCGDTNHWDLDDPSPQRGVEEAQRIGTRLAEKVRSAMANPVELTEGRVHVARQTLELPYAVVSPADIASAEQVLARPIDYEHDFTLDVVHAHKVKAIADAGAASRSTEVQAVALGETAVVGLPGEIFVELGFEVTSRSPFTHIFLAELANDNVGYVPTRKAFDEGGYEVTSCLYQPGTGECLVEAAVEALNRLAEEAEH